MSVIHSYLQDLNEKREKSGRKGVRIPKGEEYQDFKEALLQKAKEHKRIKGELSAIMSEKRILQVFSLGFEIVCVLFRACM